MAGNKEKGMFKWVCTIYQLLCPLRLCQDTIPSSPGNRGTQGQQTKLSVCNFDWPLWAQYCQEIYKVLHAVAWLRMIVCVLHYMEVIESLRFIPVVQQSLIYSAKMISRLADYHNSVSCPTFIGCVWSLCDNALMCVFFIIIIRHTVSLDTEFQYYWKKNPEITQTEMRTTWSWEHFSLLRQLCVSYYIFQHDTGVLSSPFLAAKPAYVFVGRHAAHKAGERTTLICYCSRITQCNFRPKCSFGSFVYLYTHIYLYIFIA